MPDETLDRANDLMSAGDIDAAAALLDSLVQSHPADRGTCADAVSILVAGGLFEQARQVFAVYRSAVGRPLRADFQLTDIERRERRQAADFSDGAMRFRARSWQYAPRRLRHGVREICVSPEGIVITRGRHTASFAWDEVHDAQLSRRPSGGRVRGMVSEVSFRAGDERYQFRLQPNLDSSFEHEAQLLAQLRKHLVFAEDAGSSAG